MLESSYSNPEFSEEEMGGIVPAEDIVSFLNQSYMPLHILRKWPANTMLTVFFRRIRIRKGRFFEG